MRLMKKLLLAEACVTGIVLAGNAIAAAAAGPAVKDDIVVPTVYESGHFFAVPTLANGKQMRFMLDTGGGGFPTRYISQEQADRLGLKPDHTCKFGHTTLQVASPAFAPGSDLPELSTLCRGIIVSAEPGLPAGQLVPAYFQGGRWTFDYPAHQVILRGAAWSVPATAHATSLGFRHVKGDPHTGWPRLVVRIDGEPLDMLLDTGATSVPTPESLAANPIDTTEGEATGSYVVQSTFNRWHAKHPEWKVLEHGDVYFKAFPRTIRVPHVEIAGWDIGPVWFIERPDSAFHGMMAGLMDKPPEGAVGANVFEHFRMTIDYKRSKAWFDCVMGCKAVAGG